MHVATRPPADRRSLPIPTLMPVRQDGERRSLLDLPVLVLNADFRPLSLWPLSIKPVRNAVETIIKGKATLVEDWGDMLRSARLQLPVPKVIALHEYAPVWSEPRFTRRNVFLRDRMRCQYCGERFDSHDLTFDHVIPRAKGGKTEWANIASACHPCNQVKRDQDANYSGRRGVRAADGRLRPLREPRCPTNMELLRAGLEFLPDQLREDFGSYLYWNAELRA